MLKNLLVTGLFWLSFLLFQVQQSQAAGFYLSEVGTPGSLGTAGVANPVNDFGADSSWTNPAGMTGLQEDQTILGGLMLLLPKIEFESTIAEAGGSDGGNAGEITGIPSFFYVRKLSDKWRFGFSVVAPLGGETDYGSNFVGRYAAYKITLMGVGLSPSFAYKVNDKFSLGAGISILYTLFEQETAISQGPFPDGNLKMDELTDWGYQPFLGLTYYITDKTMLGVTYRAEADVDLEGDLKFTNLVGPTPTVNSVKLSWKNPQWLELGIRHELDNGLMIAVNGGWQEWSAFSNNRIVIDLAKINTNPTVTLDRKFDNTWHAGIAIGRTTADKSFSFGFSYDSSPVSDADRTVDLPFDEIYKFSGAYGWKGSKRLDYSLGGTFGYFGKAKLDQVSQGFRLRGEYDKYYMFFLGGTIKYVF
jgi:long-chain fatty acid transport protein